MTGILPDLSRMLPSERHKLASRIQSLSDFELPKLKYFNYDPCSEHDIVQSWCKQCGIIPRAHQRVGSAWLYARAKCLLADSTGLGKTCSMALLIAMLKETNQLNSGRVLVICRAPAVRQWVQELNRMLPAVKVSGYYGTARKRLDIITGDWEVLVAGREIFNRDQKNGAFNQIDILALLIDDVDSLRNRKNQIAVRIKALANHCRYVVIANATPLQKKLIELHSTLEPIGGREVFGSKTRFENTYTVQRKIQIPIGKNPDGTTKIRVDRQVTSYQNIEHFKQLLAPMALRRTPDMLDDVDMPAIIPNTVWLELHSAQRDKYKEIQRGVLKIIKEGKLDQVKNLEAVTIWMKAAATCTGLAALGEDDGPGTSSKLDWLMDKLQGDLSDEKVLVFIHNIAMVKATQARLEAAGIECVTISGMDSNPNRRAEAVKEFWENPRCKVMLGTSSLESSLNLQCARHLVAMDTIPNPARMTQLAGRIARQGSKFSTVYVHTLVNRECQEEALLTKLEMENALIDNVWGSESELFQQLDPQTLLQLIVS